MSLLSFLLTLILSTKTGQSHSLFDEKRFATLNEPFVPEWPPTVNPEQNKPLVFLLVQCGTLKIAKLVYKSNIIQFFYDSCNFGLGL